MKSVSKVHQVFVGCPFTPGIRSAYDRLKREVEKKTPLNVVLADTRPINSSDYLLKHINELIAESVLCIFDVTGANPNVCLEVGIAHAIPTDYVITMRTRASRASTEENKIKTKPIISDLQGKIRIEYKQYPQLKDQFLTRVFKSLPYHKRWHEFLKDNSSYGAPAIEVFNDIRESQRTSLARLERIVGDSGISARGLASKLKAAKLLSAKEGKNGGFYYPGS